MLRADAALGDRDVARNPGLAGKAQAPRPDGGFRKVSGKGLELGAPHLVETVGACIDDTRAGCADALATAGRGPEQTRVVRRTHYRLAVGCLKSDPVG